MSSGGGESSGGGALDKSVFCIKVGALELDGAIAFNADNVGDAKQHFPKVLADAKKLQPPPASVKDDVSAIVVDLTKINSWVQTKATDQDFNSKSTPSAIKAPLSDLGKHTKPLDNYCDSGSSGSRSSGSSGSGFGGSSGSGSSSGSGLGSGNS